jgi:hypothetical protein
MSAFGYWREDMAAGMKVRPGADLLLRTIRRETPPAGAV